MTKINHHKRTIHKHSCFMLMILFVLFHFNYLIAQTPTRDFTKRVTTNALYFDGDQLDTNTHVEGWQPTANDSTYAYWFGKQLVADGDCITAIDGFIFFAWYSGDRDNRYIRVSRYNPNTNQIKTFRLNWQHTGFRGNKNIGESHNTIAVGISPKNKTIHLLYDMHAYSADTSDNPGFYTNRKGNGTPIANRYFRYSYSIKDVTTISDDNWTQGNVLERAVDNNFIGNYTHNSLNGTNNAAQYEKLTYPRFFLNSNDDLFFQMRVGGNTNGALRFYKYNDTNKRWGNFTEFNVINARNNSASNAPNYNWGLYGDIKFLNGEITIGFQRRKGLTDKYKFQDGMFFARASNTSGTQWEDSDGNSIASPVVNADNMNIGNPERQLPSKGVGAGNDDIVMSGPFDYTVTKRGDIHMIAKVKDNHNNEQNIVHYFKPNGNTWKRQILNSSVNAERIYTSGNKIYIIGLNASGRLRIDVSNGGANSFTKIYEETNSDVRYRNGTVRIVDGKVYFIGLERSNESDSKEPLHISVIDLNLSDDSNENNITGKWFNLKNVFTNRYLDSNGESLVAGTSSLGFDKQWKFVKSGDFYNIENRATGLGRGILRRIASTNQIVGTSVSAPRADVDKLWDATKLSSGAYQFKIRTSNKYMQNNTANGVTLTVSHSTNRSKWILEEVGQTQKQNNQAKEILNQDNNAVSISVYPNPANTNFTILLHGLNNAELVINDILGKVVYKKAIRNSNTIELKNNNRFKSGVYLIKVIDDNQNIYHKKLVIK